MINELTDDQENTFYTGAAGFSAATFYHLHHDDIRDAIEDADAPRLGLNADPSPRPAARLTATAKQAYREATKPAPPYASPLITEDDVQHYRDALPDSPGGGLEATVHDARDEINGITPDALDATPRLREHHTADRLIDAHTTVLHDAHHHRQRIHSDDAAETTVYTAGLLSTGILAGTAAYLLAQATKTTTAYLAGD